ncbi:TPA: hypothetical protein ACH3X2_011710 [Trebouxia sp. C0005]
MTEAGDVGEWLGMDSTRKVVSNAASVNGHNETDASQQHRLSEKTSSTQSTETPAGAPSTNATLFAKQKKPMVVRFNS